jgi:hypothetical protein
MSINCITNTSLTDSDLKSVYGDNIKHGILPAEPYGQSDREGNGLLTNNALLQIVSSLKSQNIIPVAATNSSDEFTAKQKAFLKQIEEEFCFYDSRYKYALQKLLNAIQQGYIANTSENQQLIQTYLQFTKQINQKLNDFSQVINAITNDMISTNQNLLGDIKKFNKDLSDKQSKLEDQSKVLKSNQATTLLNKQMVKFTEEKGRYTNNLLKMYSFLNIVALGLLIYVYRSAS